MQISKEVKTAVLVISGIVLLIFGFNYLKGQNLLDSSRTFYTEYDNVEGLTSSMPVTISGKTVGKVSNIDFKSDGSANLIVELLIDSDYQFSKNSKAELYETGLIGGKAVAIIPVFDNAEKAQSGDVLEGSVQAGLSELVNQRLTPIQENLESMIHSADTLLKNLNTIFDNKTKANIKSGIVGLNETILEFKVTAKSLNGLLADDNSNLNKSLANVETISANFSKISDSLVNADIGQTIKSLESTLNNFNSILVGLENGKGSMGKLLKDEALYNNLQGATGELESLLKDVKLHPKRYFRILSKKEIPYSEEEKN